MSVLLLDNYDSFTFNLAQQIGTLGMPVVVRKNDAITVEEIRSMKPTHIIISPGPGTPYDSGVCLDVIRTFASSIPLLGVCLGHQCLAHVFDAPTSVIAAPTLMHGKTSEIFHDASGLMRDIPSPCTVARYHSLIIAGVPKDFALMCWTPSPKQGDAPLIMGIRHTTLPVFGVQFHPESFLTPQGDDMIKNFLAYS